MNTKLILTRTTQHVIHGLSLRWLLVAAVAGMLFSGCEKPRMAAVPRSGTFPVAESLAPALVAQDGARSTDREIRRCQEKVRAGIQRDAWVERLGWAFVAKARESFDPGYYKLAEVCATALEMDVPGDASGLLLRGHVLDSLHRFKDAEPLARRLVAKRGLSYDYALLGDVLMEQGRLEEAVPAYQKSADLRPDLHSYSRAAYMRWLTGDLDGAIELMRSAVGASSPVDPASVAWTCSRLAAFDFQAGNVREAANACQAALTALPDYPPALLMQGRMRLAAGQASDAVSLLARAAEGSPLPDGQWALADALRLNGREGEALKIETQLRARGAQADPRTYSLYLATRGQDVTLAVQLAEEELKQRQDVFSHDALAWALAAAGRLPEAGEQMDKALAAGTDDARLFLHAAVIAARAGEISQAQEWMARADSLRQMLLPSEREQLDRIAPVIKAGAQFPASESLGSGKANPQTKEKS